MGRFAGLVAIGNVACSGGGDERGIGIGEEREEKKRWGEVERSSRQQSRLRARLPHLLARLQPSPHLEAAISCNATSIGKYWKALESIVPLRAIEPLSGDEIISIERVYVCTILLVYYQSFVQIKKSPAAPDPYHRA
jgi:hypothetical protein